MIRFLFWCFMLIIFAMIIALGANAAVLRGNKDACTDLAHLVIDAGGMRNAGVSWDIVQTRLLEMINDAKDNPDSYVTTAQDSAYVVAAVRKLWSDMNDPSFVVASKVYADCMKIEKVGKRT